MVVHKRIGGKMEAMNSAVIFKKLQIFQAIVDAWKYPHGTDTSLRDVVRNAGNYNAGHPSHGASLFEYTISNREKPE